MELEGPDVRVNGVATAVILERDMFGARAFYADRVLDDNFNAWWRKSARLAPGSVVRADGEVVHVEGSMESMLSTGFGPVG